MDVNTWIAAAVFLGLNVAAAASGAAFKPGTWYAGLARPGWTPPNWAFPTVWTLLFALNALAGWMVWAVAGTSQPLTFAVYVGSLMLNAGWSWLFFGRRRMDLALIDVGLLWLSLAVVIALFWPVRPFAALLVAPYLLWVTVAAGLNLRMIQLNRRAPA